MSADCGCLGQEEVLAMGNGAFTYRQLQHWTTKGILSAHRHSQRGPRTIGDRLPFNDGGTGLYFGWEPTEAKRAVWIAQVCNVTSMLPRHAAALHDNGSITVDTISGQVILTSRSQP